MTTLFTVSTPEQAKLLQDMAYVGVLGRLFKGDASAGEVAHSTQQNVQQAHHKLTRLLQAHLIEVRGERTRGGRPVKVYGVLAQQYRVPFALTDSATIGELLQEAQKPVLELHYRAMNQILKADLLIQLTKLGHMAVTLTEAENEDAGPLHSAFMGYRLAPHTVTELEEKLVALSRWLDEQAVQPEQPGEHYLLGILLSPGKV